MMNKISVHFINDLMDLSPPLVLRDWLSYPGSFVERLKKQGVLDPVIDVLRQDWQLPQPDESAELMQDVEEEVLIREVLISTGDQCWMFARTAFPRQTLTGEQQELANLQNRSLGSILFKDPTLKRSAFKFARLESGMDLHDKISRELQVKLSPLWARRSVLSVSGKPLLLTEVFLPAMENLGVLLE